MNEIDDITIRQASKGDGRSFKRLYDHYAPFVWKVAYRTVNGRKDVAGEIVQETFIRVHAGLGRFGGKAALSTWIYRIAFNAAMTIAARTVRGRFVDIEENPVAVAPESRLDGQEILGRVLKDVSAEDRFLLVGHVVEGIGFDELEAATGVGAGTLRVRLHRLKAELQKKFGELVKGASL
jgi:RNA polymerase sigma-70 factor (ECF subfamily)